MSLIPLILVLILGLAVHWLPQARPTSSECLDLITACSRSDAFSPLSPSVGLPAPWPRLQAWNAGLARHGPSAMGLRFDKPGVLRPLGAPFAATSGSARVPGSSAIPHVTRLDLGAACTPIRHLDAGSVTQDLLRNIVRGDPAVIPGSSQAPLWVG